MVHAPGGESTGAKKREATASADTELFPNGATRGLFPPPSTSVSPRTATRIVAALRPSCASDSRRTPGLSYIHVVACTISHGSADDDVCSLHDRVWHSKTSATKDDTMTISSCLLEAYLKCPTKCWLRSPGQQITDSACVQSTQARNESYVAAGICRVLSRTHQNECMVSPSADQLKACKGRLSTGVLAQTPHL